MPTVFQVVTISRSNLGAFPSEFYEDKALLFSQQHYGLFGRTIKENPKKRGVVRVKNGKRVIYRSFLSEAAFHLKSDEIGLDVSSLRELGLSRTGKREVVASKGTRFQFYYSHPNSALRMPFKIGLYCIALAIFALIPAFPSVINLLRSLLNNIVSVSKGALNMKPYTTVLYWLVALLISLFYGFKAIKIFEPSVDEKDKSRRAWRWHQRWLNFLGSLVGWIALWFLVRKFSPSLFQDIHAEISLWDVIGALIAFIGVTGYLPFTIVTTVSGVGSFAGKLAELVASWMSKSK